jgi:formylglycine-generating enzyme required for sulfatase activity
MPRTVAAAIAFALAAWQDPPPPAPVPTPPPMPAPAPSPAPSPVPGPEGDPPARRDDPPAGAAADAAREAARAAMEAAYLEVARDFETLRGAGASDRWATLAADAAAAADPGAEPAGDLAGVVAARWVSRRLLGPIVAPRLSRALASRAGPAPWKADALLPHLEAAAAEVFPEATAHRNWDRSFLDLPEVRRWRELGGGGVEVPPSPPATPGAGTGPAESPGATPPAPATTPAPAPPAPPAPPVLPAASDMILVPQGEILVPEGRGRGWPVEGQRAEKRRVRAFYIDRTEVPVGSYPAFLAGVKDARVRERLTPDGWKKDAGGLPVAPSDRLLHPVTGIPYEGAVAFAASLGKRLPSEDEWERAARGDDARLYPFGAAWEAGAAVAGGAKGTVPVGSSPRDRSPFGVLDLCGNVSEVCATLVDGKPVKGSPKETDSLVRRGGNFQDPVEEATADWRYAVSPMAMARSAVVGFRCAMDEQDFKRRYAPKEPK